MPQTGELAEMLRQPGAPEHPTASRWSGPMDAHGPRDWDDVIVHEGEARGLADTAYSEVDPDAPTLAAARRGHPAVDGRPMEETLPEANVAPD